MKTTPRNYRSHQPPYLRFRRRLSSVFALKILIVVLALALPALALSASIPTLFNTGIATNTSQGVPATLIPEGSVDPHYPIITSAIGAATPYTTVSGAYPLDGSRWVLNSATSRWISPQPNYFGGSLSDPEGNYTYRTMFDLSGFALGTVSISGQVAADNAITAIRINGFSIGYSQSGNNFSSFQAFALPSGHYLPGQNQIEFDVLNYAGSANPSGLRVEFTSAGVFSPALIARYQFDGDANDSSGNNLNGTATNSTFSGGLFVSALNTAGSLSSFVEVPHSALINPTTNLSLALWVYPTAHRNSFDCLVYKAGSTPTSSGFSDRCYTLWLRSDSGLHFTITAAGASSQTVLNSPAGLLPLNQWSHIVATVDGSSHEMRIYVNAVLRASQAFTGYLRQGSFPLRIGGPFYTLNDQSGFAGRIDEARIYASAASQSDVNALYGLPLQFSGTVRSSTGTLLPSATVTLKRYETVFWIGATDSNGAFSAAGLLPTNYTLVVTKAGYVTHVSSHGGTAGGSQALNITLQPLPSAPATAATNQTPPGTAVRPPAPANPADPNAPKLMRYDGAGHFTTSLVGLDPSRMTVVLSHGWKSDPDAWALSLALLIQQHHALGGNVPNIVVWDWRVQANTVTPPTDRACEQGIELGKALRTALGRGYSQHLHFIGHSLGSIVNCYACDYVHGSFSRSSNNPASPWNPLLTTPHVTLLDEAEVATVFGQNVTTAAAIGWKVAQLKGALVAGGVAAAADWKNPIPKAAKWVDNYISLVGLQRDGAVNVCLLAPTVGFDWSSPVNGLAFAHSYAHLFYRNSVWPLGPAPAVGFGKSYEAGNAIPPSGTGLTAGSLWYEYLATSDPLDLQQDNNPSAFESNLAILSALTVLPAATGVATVGNNYIYTPLDATGRAVLNGYEAGIEWAGGIGGTVIYKSGQVITETKEKVGNWWDAALDAASDALNSIDPDTQLAGPVAAPVFSVTLGTQAALQLALVGGLTRNGAAAAIGQPAHAWMTVNMPANAGLMAFDFTVTGEPQEDSVACAVNGQNIFTLPAKFAPDGSPVSTDMMDVSAYAGQTVELFFGLVGGTSTNCVVAVDGIRFITIPQPKVGIVASGPNVAVKWPAAAVGWVLETSDTLAPGSWQPASMTGVTVEQGVATIAQPVSGPRKFYRLRRNP